MNPEREKDAERLLREFAEIRVPAGVEAVICPPEPYLVLAQKLIRNMSLGAQNAFWADNQAATGEVAPAMLKDLGVKYVILGHSERREKLNETDEEIWRKLSGVIRDGLIPILCIGEPHVVRAKGQAASQDFVSRQLLADTASLTSYCSEPDSLVVVYEPVWAISTSGTGLQESPADAVQMINFIRKLLVENCGLPAPCVLYGGSVNKKTAAGFLTAPEIDGAVVGHASLNAKEFQKILEDAMD